MSKFKNILIVFVKAFGIVVATMVAVVVITKISPPAQGTGFDNLKYVLLPFFVSVISGLAYMIFSFLLRRCDMLLFLIALLISIGYTTLLFFVF